MKYCPNCGTENTDAISFCTACGTQLPDSASKNKGKQKNSHSKQRDRKKPFIVILAAVIAAAALIFGLILIVINANPVLALEKAGLRLEKQIINNIGSNSELVSAGRNFGKLLLSGKYGAECELEADDGNVTVKYELSKRRHIVSGTVSCNIPLIIEDFKLAFSADKKELQFCFPEASYKVFGFKYKELSPNSSQFLNTICTIGDTASGSSDANIASLASALKKAGNEFISSIKVKKIGNRSIEIGGELRKCVVYNVEWSEEAIIKLAKSVGKLPLFGDISEALSFLLENIGPSCQCFVNEKGVLIGIDYSMPGNSYSLMLDENKTLGDNFILKKTTLTETVIYTGEIINSDNKVEFSLADPNSMVFSATYDNRTGAFCIESANLGVIAEGKLFSSDQNNSELSLHLVPETNNCAVNISLAKLDGKPEKLSNTYINIFDMKITDYIALARDFGITVPLQ